MRPLILRNYLAPGDNVVLTAAVRDLARLYPGEFAVDVRAPGPDIWLNNPHLTALNQEEAEIIDLECPLIHASNHAPHHFIEGFGHHVGLVLGLDLPITEFRGDIHLTDIERSLPHPLAQFGPHPPPFWILGAGGKWDLTIKWWSYRRYQEVVDLLAGRVLFVQVGEIGNYHPPLRGVLDLRGHTTLRQLILLMHHAEGVVCGITSLMHFAAAVPTVTGRPHPRPCVVVAGGREPMHWEAYPGHQFVHTIGALPCCATGGCWKSRTFGLNDGDENDAPDRRCVDVVGDLPHCMHLIRATEVARRVELYLDSGAARPLTAAQAAAVRPHLRKQVPPEYA